MMFTNSNNNQYSLPPEWQWVLDIVDAAHLPDLGLPANWQSTAEKNALIAFNPDSNETINIKTGIIKKNLTSPVGFIKSTANSNSMPGTSTPASSRYTRFSEPCLQTALLKGASGEDLIPCIAHGDYVTVQSLQADHLQAKDKILKRQIELVKKMNEDKPFAEFIMQQSGMSKFFVKHKDQYYGTLLFYEIYFNDIDNIWLICGACNLSKSNQDTVDWLKTKWLYGQEFLDYLGTQQIQPNGILAKTKDKEGLAQVAIDWFWNRHANYISTAKKLYQNLVIPIQLLNTHVDHIVGSGNTARADRLEASLETRLLLAGNAVQSKIGMPRQENESPHNSSNQALRLSPVLDEDGKLIPIDLTMYKDVSHEVAAELPKILEDKFKEGIKKRKAKDMNTNTK